MEERQKPRRPRIGERRENSDRYSSEQGFRKSYNTRPGNQYGDEKRSNQYSREESPRYSSNRYNNYDNYNSETSQSGERGYQRRSYTSRPNQGGYRKPYRQFNGEDNRGMGAERPYSTRQQRPISAKPQKQAPKPKKKKVPEPILYKAPFSPDEPIRLNKYLSTAGVCSRREADEMIQRGEVKVNGNTITELGTKILFGDIVTIKDKVVTPEHKVYVLLNKPKNCVTTMSDPEGRLTVMDIIRKACPERIFPVGRLDRNTTGVLLLTNDGELASKLTHPQYVKKKIYYVCTDKDVTEEDMQRIADGIELSDGPIHADAISYATETDKDQIGIEIHSGRNRIIRRIFESLGYKVKKLDRVYFAGLTKKDLPRGRWRYLTKEEVNMLHMGAFE